MKKKISLLGCACAFLFLSTNVIAISPSECSYVQKEVSHKTSHKALRLVNAIWQNISKGRLHALKHMMAHPFTVVGAQGSVGNGKDILAIIQDFHKIHVRTEPIQATIVVQRGALLMVYYTVTGTDDQHQGSRVEKQESIFRKIHGKWLWTEQADSDVTPVVSNKSLHTSSFLEKGLWHRIK